MFNRLVQRIKSALSESASKDIQVRVGTIGCDYSPPCKPSKPTQSILNTKFKYRDSAHTDISVTINRERRRLAEEAEKKKAEAEAVKIEAQAKVRRLK